MSDTTSMDIDIILLARKKLAQRKIPESWIEETLRAPEQVVEGHGGRWVAQKRVAREGKEYLLRVVYEETGAARVVITAYLTSDFVRYWRETP
jgi:hypothetical protein